MANKQLINKYKYMYQKTQQIVPEVYASLALALKRTTDVSTEDLEVIFAESQVIWNESVETGVDVCEMCFLETEIDVRRRVRE